jgi:tetratricopeptide (TPR) repeat protein
LKSTIGHHDEALRLARLARDLEPLSPVVNMGIPWALHFANRQADALEEARRVEDLSPGFEEAGNMQITCLESLGRYDEALTVLKRQPLWGLALDADALRRALAGGDEAYWTKRLELLQQLEELPSGAREYHISMSLARLGRIDDAIESVLRSISRRTGMCAFLKVDPNLLSLHEHPRFDALVQQIGIGGEGQDR